MQARATIHEELSNGKLPRSSWRSRCGSACVFLAVLYFGTLAGAVTVIAAEEPAENQPVFLRIRWNKPAGVFRPLHGINKGPLVAGGLIDLRAPHRALSIPWVRLHDCHWPNADVVDCHVIFPDETADPADPVSYDFRRTDEYLRAIHETGAQIIYRLGESIDHTNDRRFTHPPRDPQKWAEACLGIIRHYNDGWADGFHYGIRYWEIWNEPENRPAMWSGSDDDYLALYKTAALRIKNTHPAVAVGGPGAGYVGKFDDGALVPTEFITRFLAMCRTEHVPLDFFSWHFYGDDPAQMVARAQAIRRWLDANGFAKTESHLNEWNYLPNNNWAPLGHDAVPEARRAHYEKMSGPDGAAFIVDALLALQDAPVDVCNLFHGETGGFGLFDEFGVPAKSYEALAAFARFLKTPQRLPVEVDAPAMLRIAAGADRAGVLLQILVSNRGNDARNVAIDLRDSPWAGPVVIEIRRIDRTHSLVTVEERTLFPPQSIGAILVPSASVTLVSLRKP